MKSIVAVYKYLDLTFDVIPWTSLGSLAGRAFASCEDQSWVGSCLTHERLGLPLVIGVTEAARNTKNSGHPSNMLEKSLSLIPNPNPPLAC